jgi:hypothetical protein
MDTSIKFMTGVYISVSLSHGMTSPVTPHTSQSFLARERSGNTSLIAVSTAKRILIKVQNDSFSFILKS